MSIAWSRISSAAIIKSIHNKTEKYPVRIMQWAHLIHSFIMIHSMFRCDCDTHLASRCYLFFSILVETSRLDYARPPRRWVAGRLFHSHQRVSSLAVTVRVTTSSVCSHTIMRTRYKEYAMNITELMINRRASRLGPTNTIHLFATILDITLWHSPLKTLGHITLMHCRQNTHVASSMLTQTVQIRPRQHGPECW